MYEFNFSLPPDYALVIRALGSLEGTAKVLDPDFKVIESAYPFVIGRLLEDPNPDMRKILRELLICNNGSIRWNRLERLVGCLYFFIFLICLMCNVISLHIRCEFIETVHGIFNEIILHKVQNFIRIDSFLI